MKTTSCFPNITRKGWGATCAVVTLLAVAIGFAGCSGGGSSPSDHSPSAPVVVTISPSDAGLVDQGGTQAFTASVAGTTNHAVRWSVQEGPTGGSITSAGVYTAPNESGTFHVVATSQADSTKSAAATVTVPPVSIAFVSPGADTLGPGSHRIFDAHVTGTVNRTVTWSVLEGEAGGTITSDGLYTAPTTTGNYHVEAVSVADATASSEAAVTVVASGFLPTAHMETPRSGHTATLLPNGKVLITGGSNIQAGVEKSAELFDPTTDTFTPTGDMETARVGHTATLLSNGKVLIVGGIGVSEMFVAGAELYDPATGTFSATGEMAVRGAGPATLLADGRVLFAPAGGDKTAVIYDPTSGTFSSTGSSFMGQFIYALGLLADAKVLAVEGGACAVGETARAELYDPTADIFTATGAMMGEPRCALTLSVLPDGKALAAGGLVDGGCDVEGGCIDPVDNADLYDPATGVFNATGGMGFARAGHTATVLPDGEILIAGGLTFSAELYDPATGTFAFTGGLNDCRSEHTATLLNDGRVLVTGGTTGPIGGRAAGCPFPGGGGSQAILDTAEIYK